jgi:hypothetical protein
MPTARELRLKALDIHRTLLESYEMEEVRQIIRDLVTIEAALYAKSDDDDGDIRDHIRVVRENHPVTEQKPVPNGS